MFPVTDAVTKKSVFISPNKVVAVFEIQDGEHTGKTGINMVNSAVVVDEDILDIVGRINSSEGC
jgi:hypothetical protein